MRSCTGHNTVLVLQGRVLQASAIRHNRADSQAVYASYNLTERAAPCSEEQVHTRVSARPPNKLTMY